MCCSPISSFSLAAHEHGLFILDPHTVALREPKWRRLGPEEARCASLVSKPVPRSSARRGHLQDDASRTTERLWSRVHRTCMRILRVVAGRLTLDARETRWEPAMSNRWRGMMAGALLSGGVAALVQKRLTALRGLGNDFLNVRQGALRMLEREHSLMSSTGTWQNTDKPDLRPVHRHS